jgi:predicted dehydrogenase
MTIRVGIIGLGHNGLEHLRAHVALGKSEIVALCDRNPARLAEAAGIAPGAAAYADPDAFFAHVGLQAVSINTGDAFHCAPFLAAMAAGLHVLIEKPLGNSEAEIRAMAGAVRPGLAIQVGYILRFNPVFARLHALAREGAFGDIYYLEGDYIHNLLYQAGQTDVVTGANWYLDEEIPMVGGGSHPLDLLRWISGKEVAAVWTYGTHVAFPAMRHDDCQVALYRFADGSIAKTAALYAPRCAMAPYYNLRAYGTRGTIERDTQAIAQDADDVHPPFAPVDSERVTGHGYAPEIEDWLDAIADGRPPRCPFADGANSTLAALCAVRAAAEGREVAVPDVRGWMG